MEVDQKRNYPTNPIRGLFVEPYTPVAGRIISPALLKKLEYCKFYLSQDANVTFKDAMGNAVAAAPLLKGPVDFLVSEISAVSVGNVYIVHDGLLSKSQD